MSSRTLYQQGVNMRRLLVLGAGTAGMSADMNHLTETDLRDDVEGIISASDFIEMTAGAQLLFI
jgi:hypothetical protein